MRPIRTSAVVLALLIPLNGCFGYRFVRPEEVEMPSYEPREVPVPQQCDELIRRAVERGLAGMSEGDLRMVSFCQQQQIVRAQEEEAAAEKIEAHAEVLGLAVRVTALVIGAAVAVATWVF